MVKNSSLIIQNGEYITEAGCQSRVGLGTLTVTAKDIYFLVQILRAEGVGIRKFFFTFSSYIKHLLFLKNKSYPYMRRKLSLYIRLTRAFCQIVFS